ncbi:MAG: AMP-binding protein [Nitrososphaeria archaeon]
MKEYVVHQIINRTLVTHRNQFIVSRNQRYTVEDFYKRVLRLANSLKKEIGIKKGTVVGVIDTNTHRYLEIHYALSMLGAIIHTINFRLSLEQLLYSMKHAGDELVFVSDPFLKLIEPITKMFPNMVVLRENIENSLPLNSNIYAYEDLINAGGENELEEANKVYETDIFSIFYTTGTTGKPKGIQYKHREILLGALQLFHHLALHESGARVSSSDVFMPLIPFFHIHGWGAVIFPIYVGAKLVLAGGISDPAEQVNLIKKEGVTWLNMVPTQLHMLLEQKDFKNLKVLTGGSPFSYGLAKQAAAANITFSVIYGGSDQLGTAISVVPEYIPPKSEEAAEWLRVGMRPFPMVDVSLRDKQGNEIPHDGKSLGEVWVKSPWLPNGYYNDSENTQKSYINGWFKTGDIGIFYPNGLLYVTDRESDAVKSGGEWISTGILEAILSEHPSVALVAVISIENPRWGERPIAIIKPNGEVQEESLKNFLLSKVNEGKMSKFWIPDRFIFVDDIPLTSAGKIDKKLLREHAKKTI